MSPTERNSLKIEQRTAGSLKILSWQSAMKAFALIFLFAVCGCAHRELLSGDQREAISQVQRWVPVGTEVADAIRSMEQHEFTCMVVDHGGTYLDCDYRSKGTLADPVLVIGHASLTVTDGKISEVQVRTYLKGP
jgi:hypothetical protein